MLQLSVPFCGYLVGIKCSVFYSTNIHPNRHCSSFVAVCNVHPCERSSDIWIFLTLLVSLNACHMIWLSDSLTWCSYPLRDHFCSIHLSLEMGGLWLETALLISHHLEYKEIVLRKPKVPLETCFSPSFVCSFFRSFLPSFPSSLPSSLYSVLQPPFFQTLHQICHMASYNN